MISLRYIPMFLASSALLLAQPFITQDLNLKFRRGNRIIDIQPQKHFGDIRIVKNAHVWAASLLEGGFPKEYTGSDQYPTQVLVFDGIRVIARFHAGWQVRNFWFYNESKELVIYSGALSGPGVYSRYDIRSHRKLSEFQESGNPSIDDQEIPHWANEDLYQTQTLSH